MTSHRLCAPADLDESRPFQVTVAGVRVAVVRTGTDVFAIEDRCSHEPAVALSDGEVDPTDCTIECAKHGSLFSLRTGHVLSMPAIKNVAVFPVSIDIDGLVSMPLPDQ